MIQARDDRDPARLCRFLAEHHDWALQRLAAHGALLFRGFDVADAPAFERVARAVDAELKNEYLGTSPRNALTLARLHGERAAAVLSRSCSTAR